MNKAAPGLVTEIGLKEALEKGFTLEVVCQEDPQKYQTFWSGVWFVRAVSEDGTDELLLVTEREARKKQAEMRKFKTVNGLISFLYDLGFSGAGIPLEKGRRFIQPRLKR